MIRNSYHFSLELQVAEEHEPIFTIKGFTWKCKRADATNKRLLTPHSYFTKAPSTRIRGQFWNCIFFWARNGLPSTRNQWIWSPNQHRFEVELQSGLRTRQHEFALKIKKFCFSPKVPIQPCRPKSDSAPSGAIWAHFWPKQLNQKAIPAYAGAHFSHWVQISPLAS